MTAFDILHTTQETGAAAARFCRRHGISFDASLDDAAHAAILYTITQADPDDAKSLRKAWRDAYGRACASPAARVTRSRAKTLKAGARMVQVILRDPAAITELDRLTTERGSVVAAVTAALKR